MKPRPRLARKHLLCALLIVSGACAGPPSEAADGDVDSAEPDPLALYAPGADRADVVATVQLLFDALESGDTELLRSVLDSAVVMQYAEVRDGEVTRGRSTLDGLVARVASSEAPLIERMWDPVVMVNGPLATLWTPYDFYVGETFSHCGIDTVDLLRTDDGWTIVGLAWTRLQPPACEMHPDGPPA